LSTVVSSLHPNQVDRTNAIFMIRSAVANLSYAVESLVNPISRISEEARRQLTFPQSVAIQNSFSLRTVRLKKELAEVRELIVRSADILQNKDRIRYHLERLRNEYLKSEMVFGYYIDLLNTRGMAGMGGLLRGYDHLSTLTLRIFLSPLGHGIPRVVVYLEQIGDGAAIMRADISLWDRHRNPCAVIKVPQNSLSTPRSSIFHEAGHQIGSITGLNREGANLLYNTVRAAGGSQYLADYYRLCATEIIADQVATQLTNWIGAITLYNIYSGSSGSSLGAAARMFMVIPGDPHLMGYLRIRSNIESCRQALGRGPWDQMERALQILYPVTLARPESGRIIRESLPILPTICRALARTRLSSFRGKSFEDMFPMRLCSLDAVKRILNIDLSNFSVSMNGMLQNPILTTVAFGNLQMLGGKSIYWVTEQMRIWLEQLGRRER
jgi:hypothetical protein